MSGISSVGGLTAQAIQQEYSIRTASMVKDAIELEGDMAMKLISSAAVATGTGRTLDVLA